MIPLARTFHLVLAWLFVATLLAQVFLAGMGVFNDPKFFLTHRDVGYTISLLAVVLLVLAAIGRLGLPQIGAAGLVFVLFILQSVFVAARTSYPAIAALHPVNGFLILLVAIAIGREAWRTRRARRATAASPA